MQTGTTILREGRGGGKFFFLNVVSDRQIGCTGELFIPQSMDCEERLEIYKILHTVWKRTRFHHSIFLVSNVILY
jgi:hypothetical protein